MADLDRAIATKRAELEQEETRKNAEAIRARCASFEGFVREAWHVLEPVAKFVPNWHVTAICQHLEAITFGRMRPRLLINVPPGTMKSLIVSVLWQAWEWGPCGKRSMRYLTTAFNDKPMTRDSRKCRDLIMSSWYKMLWPEVELTRYGETSFGNKDTGTREGVAFGSLTSQRGDRLIIDDPHSTETAESDAERETTIRIFRERAIFSVNDLQKSAIVIVMQRLHHQDVSGIVLSLGMDFVHICLPMEFEAYDDQGQPRAPKPTDIGFVDPRKNDGDLLDPVRFPRAVVNTLKKDSTKYTWAGQYQQHPTPREGGLFRREWFAGKFLEPDRVPELVEVWRHWDLAATKSEKAARSAGVKMGRTRDGKYVVLDVKLTQDEGAQVKKLIQSVAATDGAKVGISLPQDPGQAGKVQKTDLVSDLAGYNARAQREDGDKVTRARPFSAQCEIGNVSIVLGPWTDMYIEELCLFPGGGWKDQVDASSGAFGRLVKVQNVPRGLPYIHLVSRTESFDNVS